MSAEFLLDLHATALLQARGVENSVVDAIDSVPAPALCPFVTLDASLHFSRLADVQNAVSITILGEDRVDTRALLQVGDSTVRPLKRVSI